MEAEPSKADPPKRRSFKFRLRTLMIVVGVFAVFFGTIWLIGPPLLVVGGWPRFNLVWWLVTFVELLSLNIWYALKEKTHREEDSRRRPRVGPLAEAPE
jgi:hypothetical protein